MIYEKRCLTKRRRTPYKNSVSFSPPFNILSHTQKHAYDKHALTIIAGLTARRYDRRSYGRKYVSEYPHSAT